MRDFHLQMQQILRLERCYKSIVMSLTWLEQATIIDAEKHQALDACDARFEQDKRQRCQSCFDVGRVLSFSESHGNRTRFY
jgi:hypothetical protein